RRPERAQRGDLAPSGQGTNASRLTARARPALGPRDGLGSGRLLFVPEGRLPVPERLLHPNPPAAPLRATSVERNAEHPAPAIRGTWVCPAGTPWPGTIRLHRLVCDSAG